MSARVSIYGNELAAIAESQIGICEDAKHGNCGPAILKYQKATDLAGQGWPWCAAFVDWCIGQLLVRHPELGAKMKLPRTAAAFGLIDWGTANRWLVFAPQEGAAQRGDLVVYSFSHCGIVTDFDINHSAFHAIEGNTNDKGGRDGYIVARRARNTSSVRRFVRLPMATTGGVKP